jgi:prepilin-type N-terminal cleavage/methylation domain-containing protein
MKKQFSTGAGQRSGRGFTLVEMLISIVVLALLILVVTQVVNTAATIVRPANKHIDTDTQARAILDRMALDIGRMLKRTDVDYYVKAPLGYKNPNSHGQGNKLQTGQPGSDQIAFFSQVPGYYPTGSQSPISLVAYRVNANPSSASYLMLERMGKGLVWNGVSNSNIPLVFVPLTIDATWPAATNNDNSAKSKDPAAYETIGPQVFRFEYYYLLKDGSVTDVPAESWDNTKTISANLNAFSDVEAIAVAIAVIDPANRSLLYDPSTPSDPWHRLSSLASDMADFKTAPGKGTGNQTKYIGFLEANWESVVESAAATGRTTGDSFPPAAASAVRIYNRYFDLKTLPGF